MTWAEEKVLSLINNTGPLQPMQIRVVEPNMRLSRGEIHSTIGSLESKGLIFFIDDDNAWDTTSKGEAEVQRLFRRHRKETG